MNWSKTCALAAAAAAAIPLAHGATLYTPAIWVGGYTYVECAVSNVEHPATATVTVEIYNDAGTLYNSGDLEVGPGETKLLSITTLSPASHRCAFTVAGPAKDLRDFRAVLRTRTTFGETGPTAPAS